ncbi:hypothetical protein ACJMK2_016535 [Sinanodonta woodiana]|uniref:Uncharacterized protein n=1 Tax=Sinanodonta woodiana TaxID=1069815 RepID=A0ABD3UUY6_SINWO
MSNAKGMRTLTMVSIGSPNKLSNQNALEKTFLFIVLSDDSKITNVKYLNFLWKKIIENTDHVVEYLPTNIRDKFKAANGRTGTFYINGDKVNLSKAYKINYLKQIENDIQKYQHYFLLVDDCILDDCLLPNHGYKVYLNRKDLYEYQFYFNARVSYLTYTSKESFGEFTGFVEKPYQIGIYRSCVVCTAKESFAFREQ